MIGIDIGSRHIHIVEGEYSQKKFKILKTVMTLTPEESAVDGEIVNEEEITEKIRHTLKKHEIKSKKVGFSINVGNVITRRLVIPGVKKKEILPILQNEMEALMNFSEPHIVDFTDLEVREDGQFEIEAIAIPEETIKQYLNIAKALKLKPIALDIHQNAVTKFIQSCSSVQDQSIIVADIGNGYMNTYLFRKGAYVFAKRMPIDTQQYERTLLSLGKLDELEGDFTRLNLSPQALAEDTILDNTMILYLTNIVDQLQRVIQFHMSMTTKEYTNQISHIYLSGGMAHIEGLDTYIQSYIDIPVCKIDVIADPSLSKVEDLPQYLNAIGTLMRLD